MNRGNGCLSVTFSHSPRQIVRTDNDYRRRRPLARASAMDLRLELSKASVLLLGCGGAGRTAALRLAAEKVSELFLVNRTRAKRKRWPGNAMRRHPAVKVTIGYPSQTLWI